MLTTGVQVLVAEGSPVRAGSVPSSQLTTMSSGHTRVKSSQTRMMVQVTLLLLPQASTAVQVRTVSERQASPPLRTTGGTVMSPAQLSTATTVGISGSGSSQSRVIVLSVIPVNTGASVSDTMIVWVADTSFPQESMAVQTRVMIVGHTPSTISS